jgi:hypothetical protein
MENKEIFDYLDKSELKGFIDNRNKCWLDSFLKINDGAEYNFFINHLSFKYKIDKEKAKTIFDSYPVLNSTENNEPVENNPVPTTVKKITINESNWLDNLDENIINSKIENLVSNIFETNLTWNLFCAYSKFLIGQIENLSFAQAGYFLQVFLTKKINEVLKEYNKLAFILQDSFFNINIPEDKKLLNKACLTWLKIQLINYDIEPENRSEILETIPKFLALENKYQPFLEKTLN